MKRALINIDYTYDFIADDGALTCGKPGQDIHDYILEVNQSFDQAGDYIIMAVDRHELDDLFHPETLLFPAHNIAGTKGRQLYGDLEKFYQERSSQTNFLYFDKTRYSAFAGTELDLRLRERDIKEIHLVGVCTDICILHTAVDAYNLGYQPIVHQRGVASFNQAGHDWALNHFKTCLNAKLV